VTVLAELRLLVLGSAIVAMLHLDTSFVLPRLCLDDYLLVYTWINKSTRRLWDCTKIARIKPASRFYNEIVRLAQALDLL